MAQSNTSSAESESHSITWESFKLLLRLYKTMLFPLSRKSLRFFLDVHRTAFKQAPDVFRDQSKLLEDFMLELIDPIKMGKGDVQQRLEPLFREILPLLQNWLTDDMIPRLYVRETVRWINAALEPDDERRPVAIHERVRRVISGQTGPLFTPLSTNDLDVEQIGLLLTGNDPRGAIEHIEGVPFENVQLVLPAGSVLVHLIASDVGTHAVLTLPGGAPTAVCCPTLTRARVESLLRGWMWLYYWHREGIYNQAVEWLIRSRKRSVEEEDALRKAFETIPYDTLFRNQSLLDTLKWTEIPAYEGIPELPFPSWLLLDVILRELGQGYVEPGGGLWHQIVSRLAQDDTRQLILCPLGAYRLFPHHAATLAVAPDGQKESLLNRYEITYRLPGTFKHAQSAPRRQSHILVFGTDPHHGRSNDVACLRALSADRMSAYHADEGYRAFAEKAKDVNIITFIGHGLHSWTDSSHSFLALQEDSGNGYDLAYTVPTLVRQLPTDIDVVILAGCETGIPKIRASATEYKGFAETLYDHLHAATIVSTLWPVPSAATLLLMHRFHSLWLATDETTAGGQLRPRVILREAQLWLRRLETKVAVSELQTLLQHAPVAAVERELAILRAPTTIVEHPYAHPYYWAAFYVLGGMQ